MFPCQSTLSSSPTCVHPFSVRRARLRSRASLPDLRHPAAHLAPCHQGDRRDPLCDHGRVEHSADAAVVGSGVIGSSIALELARQGRDVVVLDKAGGIGLGSTSASSAIVRFNYSTYEGVALSWEARHGWSDWEQHLGHRDPDGLAHFHRTGLAVLTTGEDGHERASALFDRVGVPYEMWTGSDLRRHLPALDTGSFGPPKRVDSDAFFAPAVGEVTAVFTPDAGYVDDPALAAHNLAVAAQTHGTRYLLHHRVTSVTQHVTRHGRRWRLATEQGESVEAAVVVNAAGPWSAQVNEVAGAGRGFGVTTRPLRQEVPQVPSPETFSTDAVPAAILADLDLGIYVRPLAGSGLLVGGTEPACDPLGGLPDPGQAGPPPPVARCEGPGSPPAPPG